jgi:tRNA (guanine37-N1)-methyltransferase
MKFDIITIFPEIFNSYFNESIVKRAQEKRLVKIKVHNLRDYTDDKRKTVDDKPYGGGAGMVMKIEPIYRAVNKLKVRGSKTKIILFSPKGKKFDQKMAKRFSKLDNLIMICGRYEGVDERVAKYIADEEVSIGDYVLTGGEIPAMIVVDAVTRLIPGVIALESLKEESFQAKQSINSNKQSDQTIQPDDKNYEYPQYTRPESFNKWSVPKVLLSGDHKKIEEWRKNP